MGNAIVRQIPNAITCCNLISGCMATGAAFYGNYQWAILMIIIGAVFDFFDGMSARLLHVSSPIGKELDSLADVVTFGVAPSAMIFYLFHEVVYPEFMQPLRGVMPYTAFLMAAFSALRLAKFNLDIVEAQHGRSMAVATGVKRSKPDKVVFTYQGDGDLASIGIAETIHAMARGEKITAICINNTTYGMTGGQAGPTTLIGQVTTTTTKGRCAELSGFPLKISELLKEIDGTAYVARVTLDNPKAIMNAKKCIKKAFEAQIKGLGTGFVEILATCPTNWKMTPQQAHERVRGEMSEVFVPGVYKDKVSEAL